MAILETGQVSAAAELGPFDGRVWLNTAHQGPLPRPAVHASAWAAELKAVPHQIGDDDFIQVPERLRALLARLVGSAPEQIVLGNSTSYGLHLVANGLPWRDGDEVLVIAGDYPATILPWQRLALLRVQVAVRAPTAPGSPGCTRTCWRGCARSRRTGWRCRPGAGWTRCVRPGFARTWGERGRRVLPGKLRHHAAVDRLSGVAAWRGHGEYRGLGPAAVVGRLTASFSAQQQAWEKSCRRLESNNYSCASSRLSAL